MAQNRESRFVFMARMLSLFSMVNQIDGKRTLSTGYNTREIFSAVFRSNTALM